jgi:uncharacterized protein
MEQGAMEIVRYCVMGTIIVLFFASQLFWFRRLAELGEKMIANPTLRQALAGVAAVAYIFLFAYMSAWSRRHGTPIEMTLRAALLEAPFYWWVAGSVLGFGLVLILWAGNRLVRAGTWVAQAATRRLNDSPANPTTALASPGRRRFLEQTAVVASAAPFAVSAYGLLYGRINLEITRHRIRLPHLPKAFHGFRIAQLSDIHIGPFMPAGEIRKYVEMTNELKPDLVALTGDFITWDPETQEPVVEALAGLKAPYGVVGCMGNHELWYEVEASITQLFDRRGMKILRQQNQVVRAGGESLNMIGVDFQSIRAMSPPGTRFVGRYLVGVEKLMQPGAVNILMSHNPNTFDRAAELGIDLSLAGHTHGGQVTLEYVHPSISPSRLITPYVKGLFKKPGSQLYVNSGIGTMFVPIRVGAPPEITVFELVRESA